MIEQMAPPETFNACQLCGKANEDICEFRLWQRCDEQDNPIDDYLVTCKSKECFERIDADPLLFIEAPWSQAGPGRFMLLCGDCPNRNGWSCKHPNLKANGGEGLLVNLARTFLSGIRICTTDGKTHTAGGMPANRCEGHPDPEKAPTVNA